LHKKIFINYGLIIPQLKRIKRARMFITKSARRYFADYLFRPNGEENKQTDKRIKINDLRAILPLFYRSFGGVRNKYNQIRQPD